MIKMKIGYEAYMNSLDVRPFLIDRVRAAGSQLNEDFASACKPYHRKANSSFGHKPVRRLLTGRREKLDSCYKKTLQELQLKEDDYSELVDRIERKKQLKKVSSSYKFYLDIGREDGREGATTPGEREKKSSASPKKRGLLERRKSKLAFRAAQEQKLSIDIAAKRLMKRQRHFLTAKGTFLRKCELSSITHTSDGKMISELGTPRLDRSPITLHEDDRV